MPFGFIENEPVGQPLAGFVKIRCAEARASGRLIESKMIPVSPEL
jgi:hypothetical protein